jgi:DNA-binding XRE family transcriptional regulator
MLVDKSFAARNSVRLPWLAPARLRRQVQVVSHTIRCRQCQISYTINNESSIERKPDDMEISNNLAEIRRAVGMSVHDVSQLTGISPQTIYGIEAGRYIPNTVVALKLAWALCTQVEDLFQLAQLPACHLQPGPSRPVESSTGSWCCP